MSAAREFDLELHLLDRQVVDADGRMVSKVDDLELNLDDGGNPYVTAILVGPRALGPRTGGHLGRWMTAIAARLAGSQDPPRIDFGHVVDIGEEIKLGCRVDDLDVQSLEDWIREKVISRIPGSNHAS